MYDTPLYNALIFYIILIILLLLIKPNFMYNHQTNKFKLFGLSENETIWSFSFISLSGGIGIYLIFILVWLTNIKVESNSIPN